MASNELGFARSRWAAVGAAVACGATVSVEPQLVGR
jgi:hypothetical protein